jgi:hypothetical protein
MFSKLFRKRNQSPVTGAIVDERWLLAARGFSAVFLTAHTRGMVPIFDGPPDPLRVDTWRELARGIDVDDEKADVLVTCISWIGGAIEAPLPELADECSRGTSLLWTAWPGQSVVDLVQRTSSRSNDTDLARALCDAAATAPTYTYDELLMQTRGALATELAESGVDQVELDPKEEDTALVAAAMCELLAAEWALEDAGKARASERVGLARATVSTAVAGLWSRSFEMTDRSARLAAGALVLLRDGWG